MELYMDLFITIRADRLTDDAPKGEDFDRDLADALEGMEVDGYEFKVKSIDRESFRSKGKEGLQRATADLEAALRSAASGDAKHAAWMIAAALNQAKLPVSDETRTRMDEVFAQVDWFGAKAK